MVEPIANLPHEKMEMFSGHAAERIEPILGVDPEPFEPIEVILSFRTTLLLADDHMVSLKAQRTIGMPVVGVVQTARLGVRSRQGDELLPFPGRNREDLDLTVALQDPQHEDFAGSTSAAIAPPDPAKHGLVALDRPFEGLRQFLLTRATRAHQAIEPLDRSNAGRRPEPLPIHRHAQDEQLQQATLRRCRKSTGVPGGRPCVPTPAIPAFKPAVCQMIRPTVTTLSTTSHDQSKV